MENISELKEIKKHNKNTIGLFENSLWRVNQYLKNNNEIPIIPRNEIDNLTFLFSEIDNNKLTFQNDPESFSEFDNMTVKKKIGYDSDVMKINGCGIAALKIVLETINPDRSKEKFNTMGLLAMDTLSMHRDDLVINGIKIKRGTPVFNLKSGWYHDALIHESIKLDIAVGERYTNVDLYDIAFRLIGLQKEGKKALAILSVKSDFWFIRRKVKDDTGSNHLIIINGFKFTDVGLTEIRVTDPYIFQDKKRVNEWVKVDNSKPNVLNKNVIILYR